MSSCRFSSVANLELEKICFDILELNPPAANRFLDAREETCELLAQHPLIGRSRPELGEGLRSFPIGKYLLFYSPTSEGIDVVRVIYGGQDVTAVFGRQ